jgi:hypothetical protein
VAIAAATRRAIDAVRIERSLVPHSECTSLIPERFVGPPEGVLGLRPRPRSSVLRAASGNAATNDGPRAG